MASGGLTTNTSKMKLTKKELDALDASIDFIRENIDGANPESYDYHDKMCIELRKIYKKAIKWKLQKKSLQK